MMMTGNRVAGGRRGQSLLEYAVVGTCVVVVIVGIQTYAKRALQGRLKVSTDAVGEQFSPQWSSFSYTVNSSEKSTRTLTADGDVHTTLLTPSVMTTSSYVDRFSNKPLVGVRAEKLFE